MLNKAQQLNSVQFKKTSYNLRVFGCDERGDVLIQELQDQRNAVGEHKMLAHEFKLETETRQ